MVKGSDFKSLAVIPARGGSKRIPNKNIRDLCGKPMIAYTIAAALDSGIFSRVIVSTDSRQIADIAADLGAEVPFLREASLADDHTPVSEVILDVLERLDSENSRFQYVAQLMPNCPLRTAVDVKESHSQFVSTGAEAQVSIFEFGWLNPWWAMTRDEEYRVSPLFEKTLRTRSQDLPELFCLTGAVWWAKISTLKSEKTFHIENKTGWALPWMRAIDIDTEEDWQMAEILMQHQKEL